MNKLSAELKINEGQKWQFRSIFDRALPEITAVENERRTKMWAIMENVRKSASGILDSFQRKTYEVNHYRIRELLTPCHPLRSPGCFLTPNPAQPSHGVLSTPGQDYNSI